MICGDRNNSFTCTDYPDVKAPLSEWQLVAVDMYNSAEECQEALRHEREIPTDGMHARFEKDVICIATDDPRLKGN
jgi:hypothetical protein